MNEKEAHSHYDRMAARVAAALAPRVGEREESVDYNRCRYLISGFVGMYLFWVMATQGIEFSDEEIRKMLAKIGKYPGLKEEIDKYLIAKASEKGTDKEFMV